MNTGHATAAIKKAGGVDALPLIDGPRLEQFDRLALAEALESELARAKAEGWPKISLHMDLEDVLKLISVLKEQ